MNNDPFNQVPEAFKGNAKIYYDHVIQTYQLTLPEMLLLHNICQEIMLIENFRFDLALNGNMIIGVVGLDKANPMSGEISRHMVQLLNYIKLLNLPTDDDEVSEEDMARSKEEMSAKMRELGKKRWAKSG